MIAEMYNTNEILFSSNIDEEIPIILEGTQRICERQYVYMLLKRL